MKPIILHPASVLAGLVLAAGPGTVLTSASLANIWGYLEPVR